MEVAGLPTDEDFFEAVGGALPQNEVLADDKAAPSAYDVRIRVRSLRQLGKQELNSEQKWAVAAYLSGASTNCPFTIYGPAGTGKSTTLVETALNVNPEPCPQTKIQILS